MSVRRDARCDRVRHLDLDTCMACGLVCEVTGTFELPGIDSMEHYVRTRCVSGHIMVGPEFALRAVA